MCVSVLSILGLNICYMNRGLKDTFEAARAAIVDIWATTHTSKIVALVEKCVRVGLKDCQNLKNKNICSSNEDVPSFCINYQNLASLTKLGPLWARLGTHVFVKSRATPTWQFTLLVQSQSLKIFSFLSLQARLLLSEGGLRFPADDDDDSNQDTADADRSRRFWRRNRRQFRFEIQSRTIRQKVFLNKFLFPHSWSSKVGNNAKLRWIDL